MANGAERGWCRDSNHSRYAFRLTTPERSEMASHHCDARRYCVFLHCASHLECPGRTEIHCILPVIHVSRRAWCLLLLVPGLDATRPRNAWLYDCLRQHFLIRELDMVSVDVLEDYIRTEVPHCLHYCSDVRSSADTHVFCNAFPGVSRRKETQSAGCRNSTEISPLSSAYRTGTAVMATVRYSAHVL